MGKLMPKRKNKLPSLLRKMQKAQEGLSGIQVDKDPRKAALELDMLGIAAVAKKEGIS